VAIQRVGLGIGKCAHGPSAAFCWPRFLTRLLVLVAELLSAAAGAAPHERRHSGANGCADSRNNGRLGALSVADRSRTLLEAF
jgi:hypothetical protein